MKNIENDSMPLSNVEKTMNDLCKENNVKEYTLYETKGFMQDDNRILNQKTLVFVFDRITDEQFTSIMNGLRNEENLSNKFFIEN